MEIGLIGLGKMGGNMAERLRKAGHTVVGYDQSESAPRQVSSLAELVEALPAPRVVWVMVPAGKPTDDTITALGDLLSAGDLVIDGGNSKYTDDARHAEELAGKSIGFVDAGVSGGVWGLKNGYALMVGGSAEDVAKAQPIFDALKPEGDSGFVHAGSTVGAGHFAKMVHNGIEYGIMAAYAEGLGILRGANVGKQTHAIDAETTPLRVPEHYRYDLNLPDITEVWRRGSVIASWLLDLTAKALIEDPALGNFAGRVSDSGEGRWTIQAAIDEAVPAPVLTSALYARFNSRGEADFQNKLLSAMRYQFGGHVEKSGGK